MVQQLNGLMHSWITAMLCVTTSKSDQRCEPNVQPVNPGQAGALAVHAIEQP